MFSFVNLVHILHIFHILYILHIFRILHILHILHWSLLWWWWRLWWWRKWLASGATVPMPWTLPKGPTRSQLNRNSPPMTTIILIIKSSNDYGHPSHNYSWYNEWWVARRVIWPLPDSKAGSRMGQSSVAPKKINSSSIYSFSVVLSVLGTFSWEKKAVLSLPELLPPHLPPIWATCTTFFLRRIQDLRVSQGLKIL